MPFEHQDEDESGDDKSLTDDLPQIEDANSSEEYSAGVVAEDDLQPLGAAARIQAGSYECTDEEDEGASDRSWNKSEVVLTDVDDTSDAGTVQAEPGGQVGSDQPSENPDWGAELSAHRIVVELKRIEAQVREILEGRDSKRKRKLGGTWRWHELEEDLISWHSAARFDEQTLARLRELITKRHYLFGRLRFLAGTRPTWNS